MPPKKAKEEPKEEPPPVEEEEQEPAVPEILTKCFRTGGQLYYGDCKAGYKERKGTFLRHGNGRQLAMAVAPAGRRFNGGMAYETVVVGSYEGGWLQDVMSGRGTYKWSDGSVYEGTFADGLPHGQGRLCWPDGSMYEGAWLAGAMHGRGRFLSRFDGQVHDGSFKGNSFQTAAGQWVDVLDVLRKGEEQLTLQTESSAMQVRRCSGRGVLPAVLLAALDEIQRSGRVPFLVAEDSSERGALQALLHAGLADPSRHCASVRVAALSRRRRRDHLRPFVQAMQNSLRDGANFVLVFEDDDVGIDEANQDQADWADRRPDLGLPTLPLPDEWRLNEFFSSPAFPADIFRPSVFNGRGLADTLVPEMAPRRGGPALPGAAADRGNVGAAGAPDGAATEEGREVEDAAAAGGGDSAAKQLLAAASQGIPVGVVGQTGHFFEAGDMPIEAAGLSLIPCLRPVVCAHGRLPFGLDDEALRAVIAERFDKHMPLHRTTVLLLGSGTPAG